MISTKFSTKYKYFTFLFALMPVIAVGVIFLLPEDISPVITGTYIFFAVAFSLLLLFRLLYTTRSMSVDENGILYVRRFFDKIEEAKVPLKKFDGYKLEYVHQGWRGKDVFGYFCLIKNDTVCARVCFNSYKDFTDFLHEAVDPHLDRIHYSK